MSIIIEDKQAGGFDFDYEEVMRTVVHACLEDAECPYEVMVEITLTDNDEIQELNRNFRQIDRPTDVLSFPMLDYDTPGDFSFLEDGGEEIVAEYFDPDTGELMFGNIVIAVDKVKEQAKEYGHSEKRELAFLVAHSMFHLLGYDHMEEQERMEMENMQRKVLDRLGISR